MLEPGRCLMLAGLLPLLSCLMTPLAYAAEGGCEDGACDPFGRVLYALQPGPLPAAPEPALRPLSLTLSLDAPLRTTRSATTGAQQQGSPPVSPTLQAALRYVPAENWFANINFYKYLFADRQQAWNPDFTYSLGYDDWHPDTFSFIYGNYTGNRFPGQGAPTLSRVEQGQFSAAYKFRLPPSWMPALTVDPDDEIMCSTGANLTPRYTTVENAVMHRNKTSLALGCRYSASNHFFFALNALAYPQREQQQPWDPDFTYGFGWYDWRPGSINVQYFNYSGNRFPWRSPAGGQGQFRNGSITISWSAAW